MRRLIYTVLAMFALSSPSYGKTLILDGELESTILLSQQIGFAVEKPVDSLTFKFALPAQFSNKGVTQGINSKSVTFDPEPAEIEDLIDSYGNSFKKVTWRRLRQDASIRMQFETTVKAALSAMSSQAQFPLKDIPAREKLFLKSSDMVQASDRDIAELAKTLTSGAATEYEAVSSVLNFIADNIKYTYNPPQYDAKYTLANRSGNCQNFAHLSMALLRSVGIPARIVGGISLKEQWKVPIDGERSVVQGMGQGGHAWMEIYFPDLGWLSYDPQQSRQFTSSRHIKQTHGLDSTDVNDTWSATPYLPAYSESIDAKFLDDRIDVRLKGADSDPRPYLVSNAVKLAQTEPSADALPLPVPVPPTGSAPPLVVTSKPDIAGKPAPPPKLPKADIKKPTPPPKSPPPPVKKPDGEPATEFGNMEFPSLVDNFRVSGISGVRVLDKETSEYVTSKYVYAQAIRFDSDTVLEKISLAMHKFGGDGSLFLDFVEDNDGKPSLSGLRSDPVFLEKVSRRPGYYWVDFNYRFPEGMPKVLKGKYWIILRHSGDAIVNWFYIPGKPYGGGDDTRSTAKGYLWEDILNYDFVFKVKGYPKSAKQ